MPSILKVDSACSSQTVQVACGRGSRRRGYAVGRWRALLDVLEPLLEQADDVLVVERVEDIGRRAAAARARMPRSSRSWWETADSREAEQAARSHDAELRARQRVENADARRVAEKL